VQKADNSRPVKSAIEHFRRSAGLPEVAFGPT
jgi:hypothetical protein